ncbi:hypothetical protein HD554DRAFT_1586708 [Boletus coccyginus]|nr:hypothetical protein HD554DRAFT_1586708 [Boletus coccyginus]
MVIQRFIILLELFLFASLIMTVLSVRDLCIMLSSCKSYNMIPYHHTLHMQWYQYYILQKPYQDLSCTSKYCVGYLFVPGGCK